MELFIKLCNCKEKTVIRGEKKTVIRGKNNNNDNTIISQYW